MSPTGLRILVVENHEDTRQYLVLYLNARGHEVEAVASMQAALDIAPLHAFDVLLSDIGLDDGDGWTLLQRAHFPQPVFAIAMSGFGMLTDRERSTEVGFRYQLIKPVQIEKLDAMLSEAAAEVARR